MNPTIHHSIIHLKPKLIFLLLDTPSCGPSENLINLGLRMSNIDGSTMFATDVEQIVKIITKKAGTYVLVVAYSNLTSDALTKVILTLKSQYRIGIIVLIDDYFSQLRSILTKIDCLIQSPVTFDYLSLQINVVTGQYSGANFYLNENNNETRISAK